MAGKIIVHGYNAPVLGSGRVMLSIDSKPVASVEKKQTIEIPITRNCVLSAKIGGQSSQISIQNGSLVEIQIKDLMFKGMVLEIINQEILDYNAPEDDAPIDVAEKTVYEFDGGVGDILLVYEDRVVLRHKGVLNFFAMGIKGDKTLYYADITSVEYKRSGVLAGHIQFSIPGGNEHTGGVFSSASDENTITVSKNEEIAEKVVSYINNKIKEYKARKNSETFIQQVSSADELKKFKELLDMGIITQEEFDAKKKQLLGI